MTALALLIAVPSVMWAVQTALRAGAGLPFQWRLDNDGAPGSLRAVGRATTQLCLAGVILVYPLLRGRGIIEYYGGLLPGGDPALRFVQGAAAATLFLCALFGAWLATGRLTIDVHHSRRKWIRRLTMLVPTALFGAFVEELVFRGILLADLLDAPDVPVSLSIALGAIIFAAAHYVRAVKRRWTIFGHVALGVLLCVAFVRTGDLWLSTGLHAGGIFMIMGARPFVRYRGPAWLTGASIFPFAGVAGVIGLALLTTYVATKYGRKHGAQPPPAVSSAPYSPTIAPMIGVKI